MKCTFCGAEWASFEALPRKIGYFAGFDERDHPVLFIQRNCTCEATFSQSIGRETVEREATGTGKVAKSAAIALEDLELHLRGGVS